MASKVSYIGAPACFALEMACKQVQAAFAPHAAGSLGQCYLVGSSIERADWRDVDIRMILDDASFGRLFPDAVTTSGAAWEFDPRWTLMCVSISQWLRATTGLPVDFQFQPMSWANSRHDKQRHPIGMTFSSAEE